MTGNTNVLKFGRFDYVEPMNLSLKLPDNAIVNNAEDYSISVNLEVEIPSRYYSENNEVKLLASSDNGSITFFGGSEFNTSGESKDVSRGYLSTSWTDISVNNVDKGNKECLGIESINIAYSPNFFPIVTIKFVDVRGASLFMTQQKSYEEWAKENNTSKVPFDGASFFKAIFSMPSPIFRLTVKGFYGKPVTYKLLMSKFNSDFDSDNGNFIANVEFAGYMYGVYTELPMSFVALAPYIDGLKYWETSNFTFKNGVRIPTIPDLIKKIGLAAKDAPQKAMESADGRKLTSDEELLKYLKKVRDKFPFKFIASNGEQSRYPQNSKGFADKNFRFIKDKPVLKEQIKESSLSKSGNTLGGGDLRQVYYSVDRPDIVKHFININEANNMGTNVFDFDSSQWLTFSSKEEIDEYKQLLEDLCQKFGSQYNVYKSDFDIMLNENGIDVYVNGKQKQMLCPIMCVYTKNNQGTQKIFGVDFFNDDNKKKTYVVTYLDFLLRKETEWADYQSCEPKDIKRILQICEGSDKELSGIEVLVTYRIRTNILTSIEKDIEEIEKRIDEDKKEVYKQQDEEEARLIGFPLTIENVYHIIFAHIDTFMNMYYTHLSNINNDDIRNDLINSYFGTLADVSDNVKGKRIPPFPTFITKTKEDKEEITWPTEILKEDIEETKFVKNIINAAVQLGSGLTEALKTIADYGNDNTINTSEGNIYPVTTDKTLPATLFDFFNTKVNPYEDIYNDFVKNPGDDIEDKIWLTFMFRCAYFALIFRRYRDTYRDSYQGVFSEIRNKDLVNLGYKYFAVAEACNIKKVFGDNITRELLLNLTNKNGKQQFSKLLQNYVVDVQTNVQTIQENKWSSIKFKDKLLVDNYVALPITNISKLNIDEDIKTKKCLNDSNYLIFKNNGETITNKLNEQIVNQSAVTVYPVEKFENAINTIKGDNVFTTTGWNAIDDKDSFLTDFQTYLCCGLYNNDYQDDKEGYNIPYIINDDSKIFTIQEQNTYEKKSYNEMIKQKLVSGYDALLKKEQNDVTKNYTSFINGYECIDTVNVICNGAGGEGDIIGNHSPFATGGTITIPKFLTDNANNYDKAYLFLFSLPMSLKYCDAVAHSNMKKVCKAALLREGAFYYWQDNMQKVKAHFNNSIGVNMSKNCLPIIINSRTTNSKAPTLWLSNNESQYLTWNLSDVPLNRKEFLKNYFMRWAEQDFINIANIKANISGLTETKIVSDLYMTEVIYCDASTVMNIQSSHNIDMLPSVSAEMKTEFFVNSYKEFQECLNTLYPEGYSFKRKEYQIDYETSLNSNKDFRLSIYLTLQTLYNKFLAGNKLSRWSFKDLITNKPNSDTDFKNFIYMDSYYNEIGQKLVLNGTRIKNMLSDISDTVNGLANQSDNNYKGSVYEFLSKLCQDNGINLMALPLVPSVTETDGKSIVWDLFDTLPYSKMQSVDSSCFISMYTYKPSEHLDIQDGSGQYTYKNDSFNIDNEEFLPKALKAFGEEGSPRIPAFAVSYAKQNQSIFKKINVSTANPQITEPSIAMTLNIADKGDSNPRDSIFFGQDVYSIYSNHSYTCDVEMMGCAPIMPLMYFQLNNIPLFKGAYMIISVEHNIVAGNMTTKFKGVRVNKNAIPFVEAKYVYNDEFGNTLYGTDRNTYSVGDMKPERSVTPLPDYDDSSLKGRMERAFDLTFSDDCKRVINNKVVVGETNSWCARFTFDMAYAFIKGNDPCKIAAGGNAKDDLYHANLKKLGYVVSDVVKNVTKSECIDYINKTKFYYGDVVVYWSDGDSNDNSKKYGHTQIYVGDAKPDLCLSKWASSMMNNYDASFVYRNWDKYKNNCWTLLIFRQPLREN